MFPLETSPPGSDRRKEPRVTCNNTPAEFTIFGEHFTMFPGVVIDVSKSGMKILADTSTSPGQYVRIKMEKLIIFGEVRHCQAESEKFEIGVQISDVVGQNGLCDRLSDEQIESLVLGNGLSPAQRMFAHYHVHRCKPCGDQFQATKRFFASLQAAERPSH